MVRAAFYDKNGVKKGAWSVEEDNILRAFVEKNGHRNWRQLPRLSGLSRCGKSCRLRWKNYLQPNLKKGNITREEEHIIMKLHEKIGNKWSMIAEHLTGRSDNEIKNYWHTHLKKRVKHKYERTEPPAEDKLKEFPNIQSPPNFEEYLSSFSYQSPLPTYSPISTFSEEYLSSFSYQSTLSTYDPISTFSEEQQLVDYGAPMEIVGELISSEFWTQPYLTDNDIMHTMKFTASTGQSIEAQGVYDMITPFVQHDHPLGGACTFQTLWE